jgi:hypothetical protein
MYGAARAGIRVETLFALGAACIGRRCSMFPLPAIGVCGRRSVAILTIALVFSGSGKDYARAEEKKEPVVLDLVKATAERFDSGAVLLCCTATLKNNQ